VNEKEMWKGGGNKSFEMERFVVKVRKKPFFTSALFYFLCAAEMREKGRI